MPPVYRQVFLVILSLISLIFTCNRCNRTSIVPGWTTTNEEQVGDIFYSQSVNLTDDDYERKRFADCCLDGIKSLFPDGISGVDDDMPGSVKLAIIKVGSECRQESISVTGLWDGASKDELKARFYNYGEATALEEPMKTAFVDCLTAKVMQRFSDGTKAYHKLAFRECLETARPECEKMVKHKK